MSHPLRRSDGRETETKSRKPRCSVKRTRVVSPKCLVQWIKISLIKSGLRRYRNSIKTFLRLPNYYIYVHFFYSSLVTVSTVKMEVMFEKRSMCKLAKEVPFNLQNCYSLFRWRKIFFKYDIFLVTLLLANLYKGSNILKQLLLWHSYVRFVRERRQKFRRFTSQSHPKLTETIFVILRNRSLIKTFL